MSMPTKCNTLFLTACLTFLAPAALQGRMAGPPTRTGCCSATRRCSPASEEVHTQHAMGSRRRRTFERRQKQPQQRASVGVGVVHLRVWQCKNRQLGAAKTMGCDAQRACWRLSGWYWKFAGGGRGGRCLLMQVIRFSGIAPNMGWCCWKRADVCMKEQTPHRDAEQHQNYNGATVLGLNKLLQIFPIPHPLNTKHMINKHTEMPNKQKSHSSSRQHGSCTSTNTSSHTNERMHASWAPRLHTPMAVTNGRNNLKISTKRNQKVKKA